MASRAYPVRVAGGRLSWYKNSRGELAKCGKRANRGGAVSQRLRHPGLHDARGRELPHRLLDVMGVPTYAVDAGEGPPILLIHGYGDTADGWPPVLIRDGMPGFLAWRLLEDPGHLRGGIEHLVSMHSAPRDFDRLLAAGRCCLDSYTGTLLEDSAAIDVPLFMVWGRRDGFVPAKHAALFAKLHPHAHVHVFEDCGHHPQIELPALFNRLL